MACGCRQGRKSMFKHGGYDIGVKYTSRLRDVSRGPKRRALLGGFGGMPPRDNVFKGCNLVRFGVYLCCTAGNVKWTGYIYILYLHGLCAREGIERDLKT